MSKEIKELGDLLDNVLKFFIILQGILALLAKLIVKLRPFFIKFFALASLIIPYGFIAWIFMYKAVEISNYLRENSSAFSLLVAELAGFSIIYTFIWGWCVWRLYPKFLAWSEYQKQNIQQSLANDEGDTS